MKLLDISTAKYPNTFAQVDDEDFERLNQWKWHLRNGRYPAARNESATILMHREVMKPPEGLQIDHINGDTLDNRKSNLRLCAHAENMHNQKLSRRNASGFKGVSYSKERKSWESNINVNGKRAHLGRFSTAIEAARAYDIGAVQYHGEFARTNQSLGLLEIA